MRTFKRISDQPYRSVINQEWRRAKKMLSPLLDKVPKPIVVWDRRLGSRNSNFYRARCLPSNSGVGLWTGHKYQWFDAAVISMAVNCPSMEEFVLTLRHEFCHLVPNANNHDARFNIALRNLGGQRFSQPINKNSNV